MNIQCISTSTEHLYYISASTKLQPSVPHDYNARQKQRSNQFDKESLTVISMNIQYISTSTQHIYCISASTKRQPSVPRNYNARQMHSSKRFDEESLCGVYLAAFQG